jgi:hypothetical protein
MGSPNHWISWAQNNLLSLAQATHYANWACHLGSPEKHWISVTLLVMLSLPQWVSKRSGKKFEIEKHFKGKWRAKAIFDSNTFVCVRVCVQMETQAEDTVRTNMESMRLICDREIPKKQQKMDAVIASFRKSLESIGARAEETVQNHGKGSRGFVY